VTDQSNPPASEACSFEERIDILARELELAVKWQRPCLLLAVYASDCVRTDVANALENYLADLGQKAVVLEIKNQNPNDIAPFLKEFRKTAETVFFIDGLRGGNGKEMSVFNSLNLQREFFIERQVRVIFWLTRNEIMELARLAPDFWAHRHRVIEFVDSQVVEHVIHGTVESAWQGTGEYAAQYEDTDAKISFREALLTQLPTQEEASFTRANLYLTLGILNWRQGDYEKADGQLRDALKIAAKIQDTWFEAECFNAVALVKTSMKRIDEAIDAYKQAIHLAPEQIFAWNNLGNLCATIGRNDEALITFQKAIECNSQDPISWNGLGNVYSRIGYIDDAVAAYRKSIEYMPTFAHPWNGLGDVYAGMGRVTEAIKAYRKAIELNKHYVMPWLRLGALFTRQDQYREAIKSYQRALVLEPRNSRIWNEMGTIYLKCLTYEEAVEAFSKAVELDHGYGWALSNLALAYTQQGRWTEALPVFLKSIELIEADKDKAVSWNRLANLYRLLNDYGNAIAAYQEADRLDPMNSMQKSENRENEKEIPEASLNVDPPQEPAIQSKLEDAHNSAPRATDGPSVDPEDQALVDMPPQNAEDAPYWIFNPVPVNSTEIMATPKVEPRRLVEAESQILPLRNDTQARRGAAMSKVATSHTKNKDLGQSGLSEESEDIKPESSNAYVWNEKGNIHFNEGEFEKAIIAYNKAIQLEPSFGWPYSNLALTYLTQNQYTEAILLYQKSIDLLDCDDDKAVSWNGLGNVYRCINDYPNAVAAFQKAGELDPATAGMRDGADNFQIGQGPRSAQVWGDLGELFFKNGALDEAVNSFNKAIELEPGTGWHYNNLARVLASQGQYNEAIALYQKSIDLMQNDKDRAVAWNRLGNAYRKLNDYDKAINAYQQAVILADEGVSLLTRTRFSLLSNCDVNP
jgi:tetratricopeptide (TPR) repeat protein